MTHIAGVDEAGRGPLAGAVLAAAVILDPARRIKGLADSKQLSEAAREILYEKIIQSALSYSVGRADIEEIDRINILRASLLAMQRAILGLSIKPDKILVDGIFCPEVPGEVEAIVDGDAKIAAISAASIIAKVTRDREMRELDKLYPGYDFAQNKGYPTPKHFEALDRLGVCAIHRRSFAPVRERLVDRQVQKE